MPMCPLYQVSLARGDAVFDICQVLILFLTIANVDDEGTLFSLLLENVT